MEKLEKVPEEISVCLLECVVMPNSEVISCGVSLGYFGDFKNALFTKKIK